MKRSSIVLLVIINLLLVYGCEKKQEVEVGGEKVNTSKMEHKHCTRKATAGAGITTDLSYEIYYTDDKLNLLESQEKIIANDTASLDEYEEAYLKINKNYDNLDYYDTEVIRGDTSVIRKTTINYDKIDIEELLNIEGSDDNIIKDGYASVSEWLSLAKKFGTTCEKVTEE